MNYLKLNLKIFLQGLRPWVRQWVSSTGSLQKEEGFLFGVRVNIVGVFDVQFGQYRSAADRSPFHVDYVLSHLTATQKESVKQLKRDFKQLGIYGASLSTRGFSGYSVELLVDALGSKEGVLEFFANFEDNSIINADKTDHDTRLVLIDPVDPNRNLAAALADQTLDTLILYARNSILPTRNDVQYIEINLDYITAENDDALAGRKSHEIRRISTDLRKKGFNVLYARGNRIYIESLVISSQVNVNGPPISKRTACDAFIAAHERDHVYSEAGRLYAVSYRELTNAANYDAEAAYLECQK